MGKTFEAACKANSTNLFLLMSIMADEDTTELIHNLTICIIAAATAGVIVAIYHCITASHIRAILRLGQRVNTPQQRRTFMAHQEGLTQSSIENSIAELIPSHRYEKGKGLIREDDDGMCAVCLSEFEEGEELRTLPECVHSFHTPCIDMWLFSHSSCPICRTIATPSPRILLQLLDSNSDGSATPRDHNMISPLSSV